MRIVETKKVKAIISASGIEYQVKGKKVSFDSLSPIQKACIEVKIEEFETKNHMKWLKD